MNRSAIFVAALFLGSALPALAQTTGSDALLQRVASPNGGTAEIFVGKLPTGLPQVPLPNATLVGSVHRTMETPLQVDSYELYYDAEPDALKAYSDALAAAGWKHTQLPGNSGGFVASTGFASGIYCKAGGPMVTAQAGADSKNLNVSISSSSATDIVCGRNPLAAVAAAMAKSPLPQLHAPDGVKMTVSPLGVPNGQSAAYIHNGTSADVLLDSFAAQMATAGWSAGPKSAGGAIASQTFQKPDEKKAPWQCTISIQAVDGKPGEFIAFISAANVDVLSKGGSMLFSH
jgi:hypothetical protein